MARFCKTCLHPKRSTIDSLLVAGHHTDMEIADMFGLGYHSVGNHRRDHLPLAAASRSPATRAAMTAALLEFGIAAKVERVRKLQMIIDRIEGVIEARAAAALETGEDLVPGMETGLLVKEPRKGGFVYAVDTGCIREYRAALEQAAKECGEWDIDGATREAAQAGPSVTIQQVINGRVETGAEVLTIDGPPKRVTLPQLDTERRAATASAPGLLHEVERAIRAESPTGGNGDD